MQIEVVLYNKHARVFGCPAGTLIVFSNVPLTDNVSFDNPAKDLARIAGEWSAVRVTTVGGTATGLTLWRSLSSSFNVFYAQLTNRILICDRFDHVCLALPVDRRGIADTATIDHFLFRAITAEETYSRGVKRVTHGGKIEIDVRTGHAAASQFESFDDLSASHFNDYLASIEASLDESTSYLRMLDSTALFYSGGVDSTILATFLPEAELVNNSTNSREFGTEVAYARDGARALQRPLSTLCFPEEDYLARLENCIDRMGMPPHHAQTVLLSQGLETPHENYVVGQFADALFGLSSPYASYFGPRLTRVHRPMSIVSDLLPQYFGQRLRKMADVSAQFAEPVGSPRGFALNFARPARAASVAQIFGEDAVCSRLEKRYHYVTETLGLKVEGASRDPNKHLALGHAIDFFCDDTLSFWRQLSGSYGKMLHAPFVSSCVVRTAFSIPEEKRFVEGRRVKYLLKDLLSKRLPQYDATRRKLGGVLPLKRYTEQAPMRGFRERYALPPFLPADAFHRIAAHDTSFMWHVIIFSIWQARQATSMVTSPNLQTITFSSE